MPRFDEWASPSDVSIDTIADLLKKTSDDHGGGPVEGFHRSSSTRRLEWERSSEEAHFRTGREQGGALRWFDPRHKVLGFTAASGAAEIKTNLRLPESIGRPPGHRHGFFFRS